MGTWLGPVAPISQRVTVSHSRFARYAPVVTSTQYEPSGEMSMSRIHVPNALEHQVCVGLAGSTNGVMLVCHDDTDAGVVDRSTIAI